MSLQKKSWEQSWRQNHHGCMILHRWKEDPKVRVTGYLSVSYIYHHSSTLESAMSSPWLTIYSQIMQNPSVQSGDVLIRDIQLSLSSPPKIQGLLASKFQWSLAITKVPLQGLFPWETSPCLASHFHRYLSSLKRKKENLLKSNLCTQLYHLAAKYIVTAFKSSHDHPVKAN